MYLRTIKRKNKDGSIVEYVQLAHNVRHPEKGYPKAEVIHSFGRREQLDIDGLKRLVTSIGRFIALDDAYVEPMAPSRAPSLTFVRSQPVGGLLMLRALWDRLQTDECLKKTTAQQPFSTSGRQALFAMVARGVLDSFSTGLSTAQGGLDHLFPGQRVSLDDRHFDQAIAVLRAHADDVQQEISQAVVTRLDLNLDLVFVHLIPASVINNVLESSSLAGGRWEVQCKPDALTEKTLGLAVSQAGIPIGCWLTPGQQIDTNFIQAVEMNLSWCAPGRIVWVMDRCGIGDSHLDVLQHSGKDYILGRKLLDSGLADDMQSPKGRFKVLGPDLQIKASITGKGVHRRQSVIAYHPGQAAVDRNTREQRLQRLRQELDHWNDRKMPDALPARQRFRALDRYVKMSGSGTPTINRTRIRQEEKHDGKYLLLSNDEGLSPEILAWGHKQRLDIVRAAGALKPAAVQPSWDLHPDERASAGMVLFWLILLLMRIAEVQTGMAWADLCHDMQELHLGEFVDVNRHILKFTELTSRQKKILGQLRIDLPPV